MQAPTPSPRYWATVVVEGMFLPQEGVLISSDGATYKAHQTPPHARWSRRHPEDAMECRLHVAWPRTVKGGVELTLTNSFHPTDPQCDALEPRANRCSIAAEVVNQRTGKGLFVVRVKRNSAAPRGQHNNPTFKTRLLFIKGHLEPLSIYLNHIVRMTCRLEGGQLVLSSVASIGESLEEELVLGGVQWPWPFLASAASIKRLEELNPEVKQTLYARADCREVLDRKLSELSDLSRRWINQAGSDRRLSRDADRIRLIAKRISNVCRHTKDDDLRGMLRRTRLLSVLDSVQQDLAAAPKMTPVAPAPDKPKAVEAPSSVVQLPDDIKQVAELVLRKYPDNLLAMTCSLTPRQLKHAVQRLVDCGWYDALTEEQQGLVASYQLKKVLRLRAAANA